MKKDNRIASLVKFLDLIDTSANKLKKMSTPSLSYIDTTAIKGLDSIYDELSIISSLADTIDTRLSDKLEILIGSSSVEESLMELVYDLTAVSTDLFNENKGFDLNKKNIIITFTRIRKIVIQLIRICEDNQMEDDEVFIPSNINKEYVLELLDLSINEIKNSVIREDERKLLISYVQNTKSEIVKEKPIWKNIIGGLVIVATVMSGIADTEKAIENLNKAYTHIIGRSIEKNVPSILNPMEKIDFKNKYILENQSMEKIEDFSKT